MPEVKIFLASSSELEQDRKEFEIFINRRNKEWISKDVFFRLVIWEDFIDAVSKTRLQDEYNRAIREGDIFIMLFFTKVGRYTEEEFEIAFGQFKETGKPLIYTYFKKSAIDSEEINDEILSMLQFKKKLKELGHFYTVYKNIEDLKLQFLEQLEKLFPGISKSTSAYPKELNNNIPKTHPDDIIGREEDLNSLHNLLCDDKRVVVVNGLGGIGKTTLVQAYVSKYFDDYAHILWITQSADDIKNDFINADGLLKNLLIDATNADSAQVFSEVIRKLKAINEKPNLLVIDNAVQSLKQYKDYLPAQPNWHLLVTSREEISGFLKKPIDFLNETQSVELFKKYYTNKQLAEEAIKDLVKTVDYHTLTVEILAKTAHMQRYNAATLKQAIEKDLRSNAEVNREYARVERIGSYLSTVFSMSKLNENELWLMKQFACLPPDFISYDLLHELTIDDENIYKEIFAETVEALTKKGWLLQNEETDSYKMHRIIAEVTKKQQPISIDDVESLIKNIAYKLDVNEAKDNPVEKFIWVPFGKTILNNLNNDLYDVVVPLQNNLAMMLQDLGDYEGAKSLLEKTVAYSEKILGNDNPRTALAYSNLAWVLQDLGDYKQAKFLMEKALESDKKNFGEYHPSTAISYSILGLLYQKLGDYENARILLEKALKADIKNFGEDDPRIATRYSNLALALKNLEDNERAKSLLEKAVTLNEKNFGKDHPKTSITYLNLGMLLRKMGDYKSAKFLLEKSLASDEKNFGKVHPATATCYHNLSLVLIDLNDYHQALEFSGKALAILKNVLPAGHPNIKTTEETYQYIKEQLQKE